MFGDDDDPDPRQRFMDALLDGAYIEEDGGFAPRQVPIDRLSVEELSAMYGLSESAVLEALARKDQIDGADLVLDQPSVEELAPALGELGRLLLARIEAAPNAAARVELRWMLRQPERLFEAKDEELRLAATRADGATLLDAAMKRSAREPSERVRKGIADLWLRHRHGDVPAVEALAFLADAAVRWTVAEHVVESNVTPAEDEAALKALAREILRG